MAKGHTQLCIFYTTIKQRKLTALKLPRASGFLGMDPGLPIRNSSLRSRTPVEMGKQARVHKADTPAFPPGPKRVHPFAVDLPLWAFCRSPHFSDAPVGATSRKPPAELQCGKGSMDRIPLSRHQKADSGRRRSYQKPGGPKQDDAGCDSVRLIHTYQKTFWPTMSPQDLPEDWPFCQNRIHIVEGNLVADLCFAFFDQSKADVLANGNTVGKLGSFTDNFTVLASCFWKTSIK